MSLSSLDYFKSRPDYLEFEISTIYQNEQHSTHAFLQEDFNSINPEELEKFCISQNINSLIFNSVDKDLERRKHFLITKLRNAITKERKEKILWQYENNFLYHDDNLQNFIKEKISKDGLIELLPQYICEKDFLFGDFVYQLCPSITSYNSSCWISQVLLSEVNNKKVQIQIKIDPLMKVPKNEYSPLFDKVEYYGKELNWERIKNIKEEEHGRWGNLDSKKDIGVTDYVWAPYKDRNEIHFTCEELPQPNFIDYRGSRYFHAIFDVQSGLIKHCDGAIRYYNLEDFNKRIQYHVKASDVRKIGKRIKIFQLDGEIEQTKFMDIAAQFFIWNDDAKLYFTNQNIST